MSQLSMKQLLFKILNILDWLDKLYHAIINIFKNNK
ncbi:hypothetical protein [Microvirus mar54]|uniref:Uncharacterized protein n=1 Tax=Microvirus mar54 TaxID=2851190 RepID=A0A8F6AHT8_9VIRU|nr:hypothetical protein [Microvirus mar54]